MDDVRLCEPLELFNLLNQRHRVSRLAEVNYLCVVDAREAQDYCTSHITTAVNVKMGPEGVAVLPEEVELSSFQHVVVYDNNTSCLKEPGRAADWAQNLNRVSLHPVHILRGGFQRFSALYPFLRTEKILYTITELENLRTYPVEVLAGLLYVGDQNQVLDSSILRELKIRAIVSISERNAAESQSMKGNRTVLNVPVSDSPDSDLYSSFEKICSFIGSHVDLGSRVLVVSERGRSRCSAATIAFLMQRLRYTLEEAWRHLLRCKPSIRPNTAFLQQLSDWELHTVGTRLTDLSAAQF